MDPQFISINSLNGTSGDTKAFLANAGNFSFTFVPLISLAATIIPRILLRIKKIIPTQTTSGRGSQNANQYGKKNIDIDFCTGLETLEANIFPGFYDLFYICKPYKKKKNNCSHVLEYHFKNRSDLTEKITIGKIFGVNDCFYLQLYKCNKGFYFDPQKKKCVIKQ